MLQRLEEYCGVSNESLLWFKSYLENRRQYVVINNSQSNERKLVCGVPQGSILGPLLFNIYTLPLGELIRQYGLSFHLYADDNQDYLAFKPIQDDVELSISNVNSCLHMVDIWMVQNKLKANGDKTEFMVIGRSSKIKKVNIPNVVVSGHAITPSSLIRNLGVYQDAQLTMKSHIAKVAKAANYHLHNLALIRRYLPRKELESLVHAFVTSRLDFMNSLLFGLPQKTIRPLQLVQNNAARLVTGAKKRDHITPVLASLHWLPVDKRINFKIMLYTYKALNGLAPGYLTELLQVQPLRRSLRSNDNLNLTVPRTKLVSAGDRAFAVCAPKLWNKLPIKIKSAPNVTTFKKLVKTYLFNLAF